MKYLGFTRIALSGLFLLGVIVSMAIAMVLNLAWIGAGACILFNCFGGPDCDYFVVWASHVS
jgi:hypothetical protein